MLNEIFIRKITSIAFLAIAATATFLMHDWNPAKVEGGNKKIILNIDTRKYPSFDSLIEELELSFQSSPVSYMKRVEHEYYYKNHNETCAQLPYPMELKYQNHYWQLLESSNGTFYLFGAYFDTRDEDYPTIRILAMVDRVEIAINPYFQIWFEGIAKPILAEAFFDYAWLREWGGYINGELQPYVITAYLDPEYLHMEPAVVSIVENACDYATNCLRVFNRRPETVKNVAYCVKGLDFLYTDLSLKLVEWLELLQIMGVDKVFMYTLQVHPNITKVLDHYRKIGFVDVTPLSLPSSLPNNRILQHEYLEERLDIKRKFELIPYNDCLYKNLYSYNYIVPIDFDEVIVPLLDDTMGEFIARLEESVDFQLDGFNIQNVYFSDRYSSSEEVPPYMHMMRSIYGDANTLSESRNYLKSILNVNTVIMALDHYPILCREYNCKDSDIDAKFGRVQKYRGRKERNSVSCEDYQNYQMDKTLWKYKNRLIPKVQSTLKELGFLK